MNNWMLKQQVYMRRTTAYKFLKLKIRLDTNAKLNCPLLFIVVNRYCAVAKINSGFFLLSKGFYNHYLGT